MDHRDIIVIGSSAGGVEALRTLVRGLPEDLPAAVLIVQHLAPTAASVLPELLTRAGPLPASSPMDGERVQQGRIYIAPPDRHLLLKNGRAVLRRGPVENRCRPAIDALFRSAALEYGPRVVGIVLTGLLDDGTQGLITIKRAGGISIVQDPDEAEWPSMPRNALAHAPVDHCLRLAEMPALLARLVREPAGPSVPLPESIVAEAYIAEQESAAVDKNVQSPGRPSPLSCPECGGVLNEISDHGTLRYRCQVGHAYSPVSLVSAQNEELERALGIAVRTHREQLNMFRRMAALSEFKNQPNAARRWQAAGDEAEHLAGVLEQALVTLKKPVEPVE